MANWKKIAIGTGIGVSILGFINYVRNLQRTSKELESVTTVNIHSLKLDGLTLRIDVVLKNPTNGSIKIRYPFVKILLKQNVIGTSTVSKQEIKIPAHGEAKIKGLLINIPVTGLASLGNGVLKLLTQNKSLLLTVKTISTIDLGWKKLAYEKTEPHTLSTKKQN